MGSSKKHKDREPSSRKRKTRSSRSKSRSPGTERIKEKERHHKRHHKEKRRERATKDRTDTYGASDNEGNESLHVPPPPKISRPLTPPPPAISTNESSGSRSDSLSVEETNKLRARLGLKPLESKAAPVLNSTKKPSELAGGTDMGEFVHKPALNIAARNKQEKVKERLKERRDKRHLDAKLGRVKTLGASDDEEDASAWVIKSRAMQVEKDKADKRAKMLEELDAEFGVAALVEEETRSDRRDAYTSRNLRGLKVEHAAATFDTGRTVILTLKDKGVLEEDGDDVLVNVNMIDDERYKKNIEKKKLKPNTFGYNALDDVDMDDMGNVKKSDVLSKYDEEIDGEKISSFAIGEDVSQQLRKRAMQMVRNKLRNQTVESLESPALQLASDYYSTQEMDVKFNKTRKKLRKIRKKLKADDLVPLPGTSAPPVTFGSRGRPEGIKVEPTEDMDVDDSGPMPDLSEVKEEPDEGEQELQQALQKARRLKLQQEGAKRTWGVEDVVAAQVASNVGDDPDLSGYITLNATAEFCRTLGDIPTYGLAGNREEDQEELLDYEREMNEEKKRGEDEGQRGAWSSVLIDERQAIEIDGAAELPILDAEPDLGMGVAGALRLAVSKGYLEREDQNKPSASRFAHLNAQNYSIEDKTHIDDDKFGRRERYSGPTSDFKEKSNFQPNVKLDYIDDDGHILNAKEAFRYLSHKFHGKGPGKNKVEKRMKKNEQEGLMKCMSSTDTPLGTLNLLQQKQRETQSAFVVLSGTKQATSISKTKL